MPEQEATVQPAGEQPIDKPTIDEAAISDPAVSTKEEQTGEQEQEPTDDDTTLLGKKEKSEDAPTVPDAYEVKAPEGMEINEETLTAMTPVFKKHNLTQEAVQEIVDAYAPQVQNMMKAQHDQAVASFEKLASDWKSETIKELGADHKLEMSFASKAIDKFGSDDLRALMDDTKVGNNLHMAKFMIAVGKAISDDSFPDSGRHGGGRGTESERANKLFPTSAKN